MDQKGIFILNKILTGSLRVGVSHAITIQALSLAININKETLTHILMGKWTPTPEFFDSLKLPLSSANLNPYPFFLAAPLQGSLEDLERIDDWSAEGKL